MPLLLKALKTCKNYSIMAIKKTKFMVIRKAGVDYPIASLERELLD